MKKIISILLTIAILTTGSFGVYAQTIEQDCFNGNLDSDQSVVVTDEGVTIKVGSWLYNTITDWFETRAFNKSVEKAVKDLGDVNSNRAIHILKTKHNWSSLVPGGPKDPNRWNR